MATWPTTEAELVTTQVHLADAARGVSLWQPALGDAPLVAGGCFLAFARGQAGPGASGDQGWAAAVIWRVPGEILVAAKVGSAGPVLKGPGPGMPRHNRNASEQSVVSGTVPAPYTPGLLALREGPLLELAVRSLGPSPQVLLVDATGQDHPRRAGLAVHLGAVLEVPSVGVTHRPLLARGDMPALERGATSPLFIDGALVAFWVCTRSSARPVVAHAGWRTSAATAAALVVACSSEAARTPIPLVEARRAAREARALAEGRVRPR
jgi:deoxyribonuclease V